MNAASIGQLISDLTQMVVAVTALVVAWRGHQVINTDIRPAQQATARAVVKVAEDSIGVSAADVREIINGASGDRQPG